MTYILVDVETEGPIPADYSMICFGAIIVDGEKQFILMIPSMMSGEMQKHCFI